jgi:hypothetical protein
VEINLEQEIEDDPDNDSDYFLSDEEDVEWDPDSEDETRSQQQPMRLHILRTNHKLTSKDIQLPNHYLDLIFNFLFKVYFHALLRRIIVGLDCCGKGMVSLS